MAMRMVAAPAIEPISLAELKAHLRIDHALADAELTALIVVARAAVERMTRRFLITQTWTLILDRFPADLALPLTIGPVQALTEMRVIDSDGEWSVWPGETMTLDLVSEPARLVLTGTPPLPGRRFGGIEADVVVGYGPTADSVPPMLKRACLLLAAHWHEMRGDAPATSVPEDILSLTDGYRVRRLVA